MALKASSILFGKSTSEDLESLDENTLLAVFEGVPQVTITKAELDEVAGPVDLLSITTQGVIFKSKGEARKMIQGGGVGINKTKLQGIDSLPQINLLQDKYFLVQKGKKNYYLVTVA